MTITADDIRRVRRRIQDPEQWTCGAWARDDHGEELDHGWNADARRWCIVGAAEAEELCGPVDGDFDTENARYNQFAYVLGFDSVKSCWLWQDSATHEQMLRRLDEAIERLGKAV